MVFTSFMLVIVWFRIFVFDKPCVFEAFTIGLVGQIGSGKSAVRDFFSSLGVYSIDADEISRRIYEKDCDVYYRVVDFFGSDVLDGEGNIDRKKLASIVFANSYKLKVLESITHSSINSIARDFLASLKPDDIGLYESTKLFETNFYSYLDVIIYVRASFDRRVSFLQNNRHMSFDEIVARNSFQVSDDINMQIADFIIDNNGSLDDLKAKVEEVFNRIYVLKGSGSL